jgi:3-phytase
MNFVRKNSVSIPILILTIALVTSVARSSGDRSTRDQDAAVSSTSPKPVLSVAATVETVPVVDKNDAADDPAIWINPANPAESVIIGTNKQRGLAVYDLAGKQIQFLADGQMNNVDIRARFSLGGQQVALVTAGNRRNNSIAIYKVNPSTRMLENVTARRIITIPAYGSCMYRSARTGKFYYFAASKIGLVEQWELFDDGKGRVDGKRVRRWKVGTQLEGCVADDELGHLYIGEEATGVWKYGAEPEAGESRVQVDKTGSGGNLVADVEGITIAYGANGTGYLIVSSQGNNTYAVYRREGNNEYVKTFQIVAAKGIDEVSDTDGIDVSTVNLGHSFPRGVFVAQDGQNDNGNQNFKLVPLQLILGEP